MKIKDIPRLTEQVFGMIPVTQTEKRKALGLSSQDSSELIGYLLNEKLIKRTTIKIGSSRAFLLESANGNGHAKRIDYSVLLSGEKFSPCCGCFEECVPVDCVRLKEWVISK